MRILFLSYWSFNDALTTATVLPHLQLLQARPDVEAIRLVTIERDGHAAPPLLDLPFPAPKVSFEPLQSPKESNVLINKIKDFSYFPKFLVRQVQEFKADFIVARGAPAGALAYLVWNRIKLPFYVESFEPHAEYMLKSGVWRRYDPRYLFQQYWENQQKRYARGLMPVAENYRRQLLAEGVPAARIVTVPCSVNLTDFAFDNNGRQGMRQRLGISQMALVGIYVGKFGGIYYDEEAFTLFRNTADYFGKNFYLLLLTPLPADEVRAKLQKAGVDTSQVSIVFAPFKDVPAYLSAADFAFGLHRPTPYVSPIKIGEYWANGLPVLLTEGVGDDSQIIEKEGGGAVFNLQYPDSVPAALTEIARQISQPEYRTGIQQMARRHRSIELARRAYSYFFDSGAVVK